MVRLLRDGRHVGVGGAALGHRDVVDGLALMGLEATSSTPAGLAARVKADHARWEPIVHKIGFTADS